MSLSHLASERPSDHSRPFTAGIVNGVVVNNKDPEGLSRVKVKFPWLSDINESFWARIAVPMAGNGRGVYFLPEVNDEVLVMFAHGDVRFPYVIGALWNGQDKAPADNSDGENNVRVIRSRSGHVIKLNDKKGSETLEIIDASGKNSIVIDTASNTITIHAQKDMVLSAPNGTITLDANKIEIGSAAGSELTIESSIVVQAVEELTLKGPAVNIN